MTQVFLKPQILPLLTHPLQQGHIPNLFHIGPSKVAPPNGDHTFRHISLRGLFSFKHYILTTWLKCLMYFLLCWMESYKQQVSHWNHLVPWGGEWIELPWDPLPRDILEPQVMLAELEKLCKASWKTIRTTEEGFLSNQGQNLVMFSALKTLDKGLSHHVPWFTLI